MKNNIVSWLIPIILLMGACTITSQMPVSIPSQENTKFILTQTALTTKSIPQTKVPVNIITQMTSTLVRQDTLTINPSQTPTTNRMDNTTTPTSTKPLDDNINDLPGIIYAFDGVAYGYLDPNGGIQSFVIPIKSTVPNAINPSGRAISLTLSDYSQQVAYIIDDTDQVQLWLGNLNLTQLDLHWVDSQDWLKFNPQSNDEILIQFRLLDKFITLRNQSNIVLIDANASYSTKLSGSCDRLALSPITHHFSAWCPLGNEPQSFIVLERKGSYWFTSTLPEDYFIATYWVFSPSGDRVLYVDVQGNLVIIDEALNQLNLPVIYTPAYGDIPLRIMQWSRDGTQVLIHGYNQANNLCTNDENYAYQCWLLLNSITGELAWPHANNEVVSDGGIALSPDNKWLVGFVMKLPERYGYIISIETNEKIQNSRLDTRYCNMGRLTLAQHSFYYR